VKNSRNGANWIIKNFDQCSSKLPPVKRRMQMYSLTNLNILRLRERNYSAALDQGINLLATCKQIDADAYRRIHKGTPFYWLGTAAFLVHDYQTATFLFDAAVSEDIE
jgi:hypothetical protein